MRIKNKRGQSTVEYILLVTAVIVVIIVFVGQGGQFQSQLNSSLNSVTVDINDLGDKLHTSHQGSDGSSNAAPYQIDVNPTGATPNKG